MAVANTVISQDNSSLHTMGTDQLLDLFVLDDGGSAVGGGAAGDGGRQSEDKKGAGGPGGRKDNIRTILDGLEELWDESQYENEYNMESFMKSLGNV